MLVITFYKYVESKMCSDLFSQSIYISLKDFLRLLGKGNKFLLVTMIFLCILPQVSLADRQWSKSSIEMIQKNLTQLGYEPGIVDGLWGEKTSYAITEYFNEYGEVNLGEELTLASLKEKLNDSYLNEKLNVTKMILMFQKKVISFCTRICRCKIKNIQLTY